MIQTMLLLKMEMPWEISIFEEKKVVSVHVTTREEGESDIFLDALTKSLRFGYIEKTPISLHGEYGPPTILDGTLIDRSDVYWLANKGENIVRDARESREELEPNFQANLSTIFNVRDIRPGFVGALDNLNPNGVEGKIVDGKLKVTAHFRGKFKITKITQSFPFSLDYGLNKFPLIFRAPGFYEEMRRVNGVEITCTTETSTKTISPFKTRKDFLKSLLDIRGTSARDSRMKEILSYLADTTRGVARRSKDIKNIFEDPKAQKGVLANQLRVAFRRGLVEKVIGGYIITTKGYDYLAVMD